MPTNTVGPPTRVAHHGSLLPKGSMKVMRLAASPAPDLRRRMLSELFGSAIFAGDCSEGDQPMDHRSARLLSELPAEGSPWNSYVCHSNSRAGSPSVRRPRMDCSACLEETKLAEPSTQECLDSHLHPMPTSIILSQDLPSRCAPRPCMQARPILHARKLQPLPTNPYRRIPKRLPRTPGPTPRPPFGSCHSRGAHGRRAQNPATENICASWTRASAQRPC